MICCNTNTARIFTRSPFISITSSIPNYVEPNYNPNRSSSYTPIQRRWIESENPFPTQERFAVVSYNILGDRNAFKHRDMYPNVPYYRLKWDRRKRVIRDELVGYNADIICLQEVDKYFDLLSIMEESGYAGNYKRRSGDNVDGCAMFWKQDKFQLLEEESIEFKNLGLRDNVAQLSVFEMSKVESRRLLVVVGNIHVLYNPSRGDVKLGQKNLSYQKKKIGVQTGGLVSVGDMELCDPVYVEEQDLEFLTMEKVILFQLQQLVHSSSPFSRAFCGIV
ncbi:Endonuclease/exonuclease/phosphatase [Dillenia turbinata]|uniref:Endonuclease/exonuclease/phosphatase n=1 Tax=Dillenia turbinata TaxID=194707 RepID=A0AAN8Z2X8_9MAGN